MAKLYFRYGTVSSTKTMNLLAVAHNYRSQNKKVLLMKPRIDSRFGEDIIKSRSGLFHDADVLIDEESELHIQNYQGYQCILVDEAQFVSKEIIDQLRSISVHQNIPVICYGLRTDFKTCLFEGSKRLLEVADSIEEIKTTCHYCNGKGIFNIKFSNGVATDEGPQVYLAHDDTYLAACAACYESQLNKTKHPSVNKFVSNLADAPQ